MTSRGTDEPPARDDAAVVDQLLRKLRANDHVPSRAGASGAAPLTPRPLGADWRSRSGTAASTTARRASEARPAGTWARVALGVLVGAALTQWPYERVCGAGLLAYLLATGLVVVTGLWAAAASWRLHAAAAHVVALATVLWGLALAGHEVLPRVGPAGGTPLAWRCAPGALTATPTTPPPSG